ncbi:MAG: NFACT family protein [Candidatus Nanoarchaeia archaeon]
MKAFSSFDLYYMIKELQFLLDSKLDKVYQDGNILLISLYKGDKHLLKITPSSIYLTNYKFESEKLPQFSIVLRKYLSQARLRSIKQHNFERILELGFDKKEKYFLMVELFSTGNVILCDKDYKIINCLHNQVWRHRVIKPKEKYSYPPSSNINPFNVEPDDLKHLTRDNIVKSLAVDFNMGGIFAEEICTRAGIDKNKKQLNDSEIKKIISVIDDLKNITLKPNISSDNVFPFEFSNSKPIQYFDSFSAAIDFFDSNIRVVDGAYAKKLSKLNTIIEKQKEQLELLKQESMMNKEIGDAIYRNYVYIKEVFDTVKAARDKKFSWDEIAKRLKTKGIEVKQGKVVLELE